MGAANAAPTDPSSNAMDIDVIISNARDQIAVAVASADLDRLETEYLGRKGSITTLRRTLGQAAPEDRPALGQAINDAATQVEQLLAERRDGIQSQEIAARLAAEAIDVTLPGAPSRIGRTHPMTATINRVREIMTGLGFEFHEYPDVEDFKYNFEALNYPEEHPAFDEQMSFFIEGTAGKYMMRTQTTAFQGLQ